MTLLGIDTAAVSVGRGRVDWRSAHRAGVAFAWAKAVEGATWHDPLWGENLAGALAAGVLVGGYGFARPGSDAPPRAQAAALAAAVGAPRPGVLPPALDIEVAEGKSPAELCRWVGAYLDELRAHGWTGQRGPILYTYRAFLGHELAGLARSGALPRDARLWIADYSTTAPAASLWGIPWRVWQRSSSGRIAGVPGRVDVDVTNLPIEELRRWAGITPAPAPVKVPAPRVPRLVTYTVRPGDTLWSIAAHYLRDGSHWPTLARLNRLANPNALHVGQRLQVPA